MTKPANNFISRCQSHVCLYSFTFSINLLGEITSVWKIISCSLVDSCQCLLHTEDWGIAPHRNVAKSSQCTKQNGVTSQKPVISTLTAITAQNISWFLFSLRNSPSGPLLHDHTQLHITLTTILWTSDQPDDGTSTLQHTTFAKQRHSCPQRDSNPLSQQVNLRRPTP
jgi:hypothetical protein